jgi:hypothetical protein
MRPVRGVAGMDSLSPVLELLEGIEDAAHEILSRTGGIDDAQVDLLAAGRDALAAAGEAVERGATIGDSPAFERFRQARDRVEAEPGGGDADVVPVATLFYDDAGPHVVSSPMAPAAGAEGAGTLAGDVEGFLRIEATGFLDRAEGLVASLSARPSRFARTARDLRELARGVGELAVTYGMTAIAAAAEDAAVRIAQSGSPEEARGALRRLRASLPGAAPLAESAVEVEPESVPAEASPSTPASGDGVVPIEALQYDPDAALREALAMRERVTALAGAREGTPLADALDELFGLVRLGAGRRAA